MRSCFRKLQVLHEIELRAEVIMDERGTFSIYTVCEDLGASDFLLRNASEIHCWLRFQEPDRSTFDTYSCTWSDGGGLPQDGGEASSVP